MSYLRKILFLLNILVTLIPNSIPLSHTPFVVVPRKDEFLPFVESSQIPVHNEQNSHVPDPILFTSSPAPDPIPFAPSPVPSSSIPPIRKSTRSTVPPA